MTYDNGTCISAAGSVTINPPPTAPAAPVATATSPATCTDLTGTITFSSPTPAAGITYSIDGINYTNTTGVFTNVAPGTYNITYDNGTCISAAGSVTINPPPTAPAAPVATATSPANCTIGTGTITFSSPTPAAGITYSIDGINYTNTTGVFTGIAPGTYPVTYDNGTCISAAGSVTINPPPTAPAAPVATATSPATCTDLTGTITFSSPTPAAGITYSIDGINYTNTTGVFTNVAPGTYNITYDNGTCISAAGSVTINPPPTAPAAPVATATSPANCTIGTGTITFSSPAPAAGITYSIDGINYTNTTGVFTGIAPGTYPVTYDNGTCISAAGSVTINPPPTAPAAPVATATSPATCTDLTGTITFSSPTPAAGITYSIDGINYTNTTGVFTNVAPGTYNITYDNGTCISAAGSVTINPPPTAPAAPVATATSPANCTIGTGTITFSSPTPAAGITYSIDGINYTNTTGVFTGIAPGTYPVTYNNGTCISAAGSVTINPPPTAPAAPVATATSPATCTDLTGTITFSSPTPAAGITYSIDGINYTNTTGVFTNVAPGTYNITYDNGTCISAAGSVTINPPPTAPAAQLQQQPVLLIAPLVLERSPLAVQHQQQV